MGTGITLTENITTVVRRKGKEYTVFSYCLTCGFFVSKNLQCRAYPQVNKNKPTLDTDRAYKYNSCGDWTEK